MRNFILTAVLAVFFALTASAAVEHVPVQSEHTIQERIEASLEVTSTIIKLVPCGDRATENITYIFFLKDGSFRALEYAHLNEAGQLLVATAIDRKLITFTLISRANCAILTDIGALHLTRWF